MYELKSLCSQATLFTSVGGDLEVDCIEGLLKSLFGHISSFLQGNFGISKILLHSFFNVYTLIYYLVIYQP